MKIKVGEDGKERRIPTNLGNSIGITLEERNGTYRTYHVTVYNSAAQKFIIQNIDKILNSYNKFYLRNNELWSDEEEELLISFCEQNKPLTEIGLILERKNNIISQKIKLLNLTAYLENHNI